MKKGEIITLTNEDQILIHNMNKKILSQGREHFVNNYKRDDMSFSIMNLNGFGAELAFCRMTGAVFDETTNGMENHFMKVDCTLKDGRTVDVKNTIYTSGKLLCRKGKEDNKVDIFALMIGKFPTYTFAGWTTYEHLIQKKNLTILNGRKSIDESYCLNQSELKSELIINNLLCFF